MQQISHDTLFEADRLPISISPQVAENMDRILTSIRQHLRMDVAFISEFLGSGRMFRTVDTAHPVAGVSAGAVLSMASGYCQYVVEGRLPELIPDTSAVPLALTIPETYALPIGAHLSVPIRNDQGAVFGTFCCFSHRAMPELGAPELELMHIFSRLVARELSEDVTRDRQHRSKINRVHAAMWGGDPKIVFQPLFRVSDGAVTGVEALSRFPTLSDTRPDQVYAEAHAVGMGGTLEMLAARRAVALCRDLPDELLLHINVSPHTLMTEDLRKTLHGFDPRRVVVELTEHDPVEDYEGLILALHPLREAGMQVAIDDAGAGYSSLRHVLMMRPDVVKLDVTLTRHVDTDGLRKAMAAALVEYARRTGTIVVAEGVETEAELETLRELGIDEAQGYHLGMPEPIGELLKDMN